MSTTPPTPPTPETNMVARFMKEYGPTAFGVVLLLLIWKTIVAPELQAARVQTASVNSAVEDMRIVVGTLRDITHTQSNVAAAMRDTAKVLSDTVREIGELRR